MLAPRVRPPHPGCAGAVAPGQRVGGGNALVGAPPGLGAGARCSPDFAPRALSPAPALAFGVPLPLPCHDVDDTDALGTSARSPTRRSSCGHDRPRHPLFHRHHRGRWHGAIAPPPIPADAPNPQCRECLAGGAGRHCWAARPCLAATRSCSVARPSSPPTPRALSPAPPASPSGSFFGAAVRGSASPSPTSWRTSHDPPAAYARLLS